MKKDGFTIIEVMVALAIVGISLGVFISILGNSMRTRWKMEEHAKNLLTARVTAEKFRLGLLEGNSEGETENGIPWETTPIEVTKRKNDEDEFGSSFGDEDSSEIPGGGDGSNKKIDIYNVIVGGIQISSSKSVKQ